VSGQTLMKLLLLDPSHVRTGLYILAAHLMIALEEVDENLHVTLDSSLVHLVALEELLVRLGDGPVHHFLDLA